MDTSRLWVLDAQTLSGRSENGSIGSRQRQISWFVASFNIYLLSLIMRTVAQILAIGNESVLRDLLNEILGCIKIPYPVQLIIFMNLYFARISFKSDGVFLNTFKCTTC